MRLEHQVRERTSQLKLYRDIVASDAAPIVAFDTNLRVTGLNEAHRRDFLRVMGREPGIGEVLPDLFPPDQAAPLRGLMNRAL